MTPPGEGPKLLQPLPATGTVPPIVDYQPQIMMDEGYRAREREYERQLRTIRYKYLGSRRLPELRQKGLLELTEFTDPASFGPMVEVFKFEKDDVKLAMLDHFAAQSEQGQAILAWIAIYNQDDAMRHEATKRLGDKATEPVLHHLDVALRSDDHDVAIAAATLAGTLHAAETIPLLIFAQAAGGPVQPTGDLAWIAIERQIAYVQGVIPVVGSSAGAFIPIIGKLSDGTLMRVVDAVVIVYRTQIHTVLVAMTTAETGQSTAALNYDLGAWWHWYNDEYVPLKNDQIMEEWLASQGVKLGDAPAAAKP